MTYWHPDDLALAARALKRPAEPTGNVSINPVAVGVVVGLAHLILGQLLLSHS
ncbi:MAG TPA: hypothetical protein VEQ12_01355 [Candidatus Limnocylindria bacterium]|nr:hypothetical protein [Candidatus Limnocylindria bacterium]